VRAFLISDSCTTGWLHWGHGELWLTTSHLVRIGRPELTRRAAGWGGTRGDNLFGSTSIERPFPGAAIDVSPEQWDQEIKAEPSRTLMLALEEVAKFQFRQGFTASRLGVGMADGVKHKLLWLPNAHSKTMLAEALGARLAFR
jgi:hypothetical protein